MSLNIYRETSINLFTWEKIEQDNANGKHTYRANVPGGWLLRLVDTLSHPQGVDYIFISDPKHAWGTDDKSAA